MRPETGPIKFEDDWTGIFIRGDRAHVYAFYLEQLLTLVPRSISQMHPARLSAKGLSHLLRRSSEGSEEPQRAKLLESSEPEVQS